MKKNIGTPDRIVRLCIGIFLFVGVFFVSGIVPRIILSVFALFSIYEALIGWCAFYALIGRNTCPIE
jgi:hypothetical protein